MLPATLTRLLAGMERKNLIARVPNGVITGSGPVQRSNHPTCERPVRQDTAPHPPREHGAQEMAC